MTVAGGVRHLAVVSPVFNDWVCADELATRLANLADALPPIALYLVDDGSSDRVNLNPHRWADRITVNVITAGTNLGHQRAIAVGLVQVVTEGTADAIAVIDADGEDDPATLPRLLEGLTSSESTGALAIVAQRQSRTEAMSFRAFYRLFKAGFHALTGRRLDFGNYCVLNRRAAERLVHMPELWNHFPATIMRSRIEIAKVPTDRGHRFHGSSRMNFVSLVNHGLAAIAAFSDVVFARLLILVSFLSAIAVAAAVVIVGVRMFTATAIPGWATAAMGFVLLALIQFLTLLAVMTFIQLSARSNIPTTPLRAAPNYLSDVRRVSP